MTTVRQRAQFGQRRMQSDVSSYVRDPDSVRSVARVYEPSLQEKARAALEGRWGFYLEIANFVLSVLIFSIYIAEVSQLSRLPVVATHSDVELICAVCVYVAL